MPTQSIIWTALPNGLKGEPARPLLALSVFISPRLGFDGDQTTGSLRSFPLFLNWPERVRSPGFAIRVKIGSGADVAARIVTRQTPDSAIWQALFNPDTFVRARRPAPAAPQFQSFPASELSGKLSNGYAGLLEKSPFQTASNAALQGAFPELHRAMTRAGPASGPSMRARMASAPVAPGAELDALRRDLADDLLRADSELSLAEKVAAAGRLAQALASAPNARAAIPVVPETSDPASVYAQFAAFHQRAPKPTRGPGIQTLDAPAEQDSRIDFHQLLSALGDYPDLLRRLGLVIDLELDARDEFKSAPGALKSISIVAPSGLSAVPHAPATHYLYDPRPGSNARLPFPHFVAAPRAWASPPAAGPERAEIIGGLRNLALPRTDRPDTFQFNLIQVDLDGAGSKLLNAMKAVAGEQTGAPPVDGRTEPGPPTLRTSGISMVRAQQAEELLGDLPAAGDRDAALQRGTPLPFFAEDLVRGHRIDVRGFPRDHQVGGAVPLSAIWLSLHQRLGTFSFGTGPGGPSLSGIAEEGFIQPVLVQDAGDDPRAPSPVRVHESILNWRGWSLSAPPPMTPSTQLLQSAPGAAAQAPALPNASITFEAEPGSLPRLRFGHYYQMRARTVDLAGNGLTLNQADDLLDTLARNSRALPVLFEKAEDFFRYRRFEPIEAPAIVMREELRDGETEAILVIRSPGAPRSSDEPQFPVARTNPEIERHVVPPKATQDMIETHGLLDGAFGPAGRPREAFNICRKLGGSLNHGSVVNARTGEPEALPDEVALDPVTGTQIRVPNGIKFVRVGGSASTEGYTVHFEKQLRLPYLPDPIARGTALFGLPGVIEESGELDGDTIDWTGSDGQLLPDDAIKALGCVTKIGFGNRPDWHDRLPFRLRLSSLPGESPPQKPAWDASQRVLTVKLAPGQRQTIWLSSYPDERDVPLMGVHRWSLNRVGHQTDSRHFINTAPHGALSMLSPARKLELVHAVQRPVHRPIENPPGSFGARKLVDDETVAYIGGKFKIHTWSTAKLDLMASWSEPGEGPGGAGRRTLTTHVFDIPVHLEGSSPVVPDSQKAIYDHIGDTLTLHAPSSAQAAKAKRHLARHEFGDTKFRRVTYRLIATSRFRDFYPKAISDDLSAISCFAETTVDVDSSAAPAALEVAYIVPAVQWDPVMDEGVVVESHRLGGGLRVYLGASWNSSGDGEQLAVLEGDGVAGWGVDPIHHAPAGSVTPTVEAVTLPEPAGVKIYPFDVAFDEAAGLWFSDISFSSEGNHFPFIKLSLARYQRHSLKGKHLSPRHYAGFHQLAPNRSVTLERVPLSGTGTEITITITEPGPLSAPLPTGRIGRLIEVTLEEREAARRDWDKNLGWRRAETQPAGVPASSPAQLWRGKLSLRPGSTGSQRRLVVREFELFPRNEQVPPGQAWLGEAPGSFSRRLIYADTIPLA